MSGRHYTKPNGDQPCEEECFDFMWPRNSNITVFFFDTSDDNVFNGGSIQEYTPNSEESIKRCETPSADGQNLRIGGMLGTLGSDYMSHADNRHRMGVQEIRTRAVENAVGVSGHVYQLEAMTWWIQLCCMFQGFFYHFRNMRFNSLGSDYKSHADNRNRAGDQEIRTITVEKAATITDEVSVSNVHNRGCLHTVSTAPSIQGFFTRVAESPLITTSLEESIHQNAIRTEDILRHTASSSRMAPFNHAYLWDSLSYIDLGDCDQECRHCGCLFWYNERLKGNGYGRRAEYHLCCGGGKIYLPLQPNPPVFIHQLLRNSHFMEHIRAYNQMFLMTSFRAKINDSVNRGRGRYVFKVSGQIYHWIWSLCPEEGHHPRFLQLYIYDTQKEVANRMQYFRGHNEDTLNPKIVEGLIHVLDEHNVLVRLFRTTRDRCSAGFKIRLYNNGSVRGYELPTSDILGGTVFEDGPNSRTDFDVIIEFRGGPPQRINKLHQSYLSLQFPLLFIFGQSKFYPDLVLKPRDGRARYVVAVFCAIEQGRDREGIQAGSKIMLPRTFTRGPRYMYNHYLDALAICSSVHNRVPKKRYKVVTELMMYGPCGTANPSASCTEKGAYNKNFPKRYNENTFFDTNGYTHYQRRQTEVHIMKGESRLDNCNVVPYNHMLLMAFHAHINVEYCGWSMLIKYLFKYISKGHEHILAKINRPLGDASTSMGENHIQVDEIQNYVDGRFVCPFEACWRIFDFPIHSREPAVQILNVHLENTQRVNFRQRDRLDIIVNMYNNENTDDRHLTYLDLPSEFVWDACEALGLLGDDKEWDIALKESTVSASSTKLWRKHWMAMKDDIPTKVSEATCILNYHVNTPELQGYILHELEAILNGFRKSVKEFGLPPPPDRLLKDLRNLLLMEERNYKHDLLMQDAAHFVPKLNHDQKEIYNLIINASEESQHELLFFYGHSGTGKMFLWKTIISSLRSLGKIVLVIASSGITSLLLPAGRTSHSRFKLPLDLTDESVCHAKKHSQLKNLLVETDLIIWDEAPMNDRRCFEALERTLRDLMNAPEILFEGKTVVLGGDFRQTLPVKKGVAKEELIHASIAESYLWLHFKICTLKENTRLLRSDLCNEEREWSEVFAKWLLDGLLELIDLIYDDTTLKAPTAGAFQEKAIVCPKNDTADAVNAKILSSVEGVTKTYLSRDEAIPTGGETTEGGVTNYDASKCKPGWSLMQRSSRKMSETTIASLKVGQENCVLEVKNNAVQANMDVNNIDYFDALLKPRTAYRISNFICEKTKPYQPTLENKISLRFGKITTFEVLEGKESEFPEHYFEFTAYNQLPLRVPYRDEDSKMIYPILIDYLGCIRSISDIIPSGDANTVQNGNVVEFTMWDDLTKQFNKQEIEKLPRPIIIVVSSYVQLSATLATHYYINRRTQEAADAYTMEFQFAPSAKKEAGQFIVNDILDIQPTIEQQTAGTKLATNSALTVDESTSKDKGADTKVATSLALTIKESTSKDKGTPERTMI
ncbi:DNA helicase [Tanacetum coccineum]